MTTKPSRVANFSYWLLTVFFWLMVVAGVVAPVAAMAVDQIPIDAQLSRDEVRAPGYVELPPNIEATVLIADPTTRDRALLASLAVVLAAFTAYGVSLLRGLASSVRGGEPFDRSNVDRLRRLGALFIFAPLVFGFMLHVIGEAVLPERPGLGMGVNVNLSSFVSALAVLVLAEVFAHGVRMRADLEGTV